MTTHGVVLTTYSSLLLPCDDPNATIALDNKENDNDDNDNTNNNNSNCDDDHNDVNVLCMSENCNHDGDHDIIDTSDAQTEAEGQSKKCHN